MLKKLFESYLLKSSTLQEAIYQTLRAAILNNNVDDSFTENEIAKILEVSRTPVREAMKQLAQEGLIEIAHGRKVKINFITDEDAQDIFIILNYLHLLSAELCAKNATDDDLLELEEIVELIHFYTDRKDYDKLTIYNAKFHLMICKFSKNKWLLNIMKSLMEYTYPYRKRTISNAKRIKKARDEHTQIYKAIKSRNLIQVRQAVNSHIQNAFNSFQSSVLNKEDERINEQ